MLYHVQEEGGSGEDEDEGEGESEGERFQHDDKEPKVI